MKKFLKWISIIVGFTFVLIMIISIFVGNEDNNGRKSRTILRKSPQKGYVFNSKELAILEFLLKDEAVNFSSSAKSVLKYELISYLFS